MYTFSMPFEIIVGAEAIRFGTTGFLTLVGPCVSQLVFPIARFNGEMPDYDELPTFPRIDS